MERLRVESESSGATPWQDLTVRRLRIAARRASILGRRTVWSWSAQAIENRHRELRSSVPQRRISTGASCNPGRSVFQPFPEPPRFSRNPSQ